MRAAKLKMTAPKIKFNNGNEFPIFGLGTWKSKPGEVKQAVKDAIDIGYRHIDGAHVYENEREVGAGIAEKIKEGVVKRSQVYVTSKLWCTHHRPAVVESALRTQLGNLGLDYLDLYLMHWPFAFKEGDNLFPMKGDSVEFMDIDYVDTWKAMEELVGKGLVKNIGISNFNHQQIERLLTHVKIVPVTNQVECSPYLNQKKLIEFCKEKDITITAYSPLGSPDRPNYKPGDALLLEDPKFKEIATKYKKTPAQIVLRYQVQRGIITIPKSVTRSRIAENFAIFDFELSPSDMQHLDGFDCNGRTCTFDITKDAKDYPFAPGIEF